MKFKDNQKLYYSNPFCFTVEKVVVKFYNWDDNRWVDEEGAYLHQDDLFATLNEAKSDCVKKLNEFYSVVLTQIINQR